MSKVAESVTVCGLPEASAGSVYSTRSMSPCRTQFVDPVPGQSVDAGPWSQATPRSSSNVPDDGAVSAIEP